MNLGLEIIVSAVFVAVLYFAFRRMLLLFAEHELKVPMCSRRENAIEIFADADALEYYVRLALVAADGKTAVVAYLKRESADRADMLDTILRFRRTHKNLSYQWI